MKHLIFRIILCGLLGYSIPAFAQVELIAHPNQDTTRVSGPGSTFYEFQGKVYFNTSDQLGGALYVTDGTTAGTRCITRDIYPMGFTSCGGWLYVYGSKPQYSQLNDNPWGKFAIWRMKADGSDRGIKPGIHYRVSNKTEK
jgi:ELWxxDGT repeat protein